MYVSRSFFPIEARTPPESRGRDSPRHGHSLHHNIWISPTLRVLHLRHIGDSLNPRFQKKGSEAHKKTLKSGTGLAKDRVLRGGSWNNTAENCRAAYRNRNRADNFNRNNGLRACLVPSTIHFRGSLRSFGSGNANSGAWPPQGVPGRIDASGDGADGAHAAWPRPPIFAITFSITIHITIHAIDRHAQRCTP